MNVLITGATGHLGRALCERIATPISVEEEDQQQKKQTTNNNNRLDSINVRKNYKLITVTGRNEKIGKELEKNFTNVKFIPCDLSKDKEKVFNLCQNKHVIYHCAALSTNWQKPSLLHETNVIGTKNLIDSCIQLKKQNLNYLLKRFIFIGTPSIYVNKENKLNIKEDNDNQLDINTMTNEYAKSKYLAERICLNSFKTNQLPVVSIRPRAVIGIHDTAILPRVIEGLKKKRFVNLNKQGEQRIAIELTFIENVIDAILLAERSEKCLGKAYNITNGEPLDLMKLCKEISNDLLGLDFQEENSSFFFNNNKNVIIPRKVNFQLLCFIAKAFECIYSLLNWYETEPPITVYSVCTIGKSFTFDLTNAKNDLDYEPRVDIKDGIKQVLHHYKQSKL